MFPSTLDQAISLTLLAAQTLSSLSDPTSWPSCQQRHTIRNRRRASLKPLYVLRAVLQILILSHPISVTTSWIPMEVEPPHRCPVLEQV